ncbi:MAG: hypothetical protein OEZ06_02550 [Myxococcales bacterium]|nr:hypothetical protein [Myxococcales bacterium]
MSDGIAGAVGMTSGRLRDEDPALETTEAPLAPKQAHVEDELRKDGVNQGFAKSAGAPGGALSIFASA